MRALRFCGAWVSREPAGKPVDRGVVAAIE
jgi:hypothetical protein